VIIEIKSIEAISPVHRKQLLTYLRVTDKHLGMLINFNVDGSSTGSRVVNNLSLGIDEVSRKGAKKGKT
jgi:GxxExxY protein